MDTIEARLKQFLTMEELSPAAFADMLGIQRSGISHLLSGRNNPSYDFITKMLVRFPELSADWLIMGKGKPYKDVSSSAQKEETVSETRTEAPQSDFTMERQSALFDDHLFGNEQLDTNGKPSQPLENAILDDMPDDDMPISEPKKPNTGRHITRITIFYSDGTYEEK